MEEAGRRREVGRGEEREEAVMYEREKVDGVHSVEIEAEYVTEAAAEDSGRRGLRSRQCRLPASAETNMVE